MQRTPSDNVSGPPSRSNSYRFTDMRSREDNRSRDDLYLSGPEYSTPNVHPARRQASFTDRDYVSRSDSYGSASSRQDYGSVTSRQDMYTPPVGFVNQDGYNASQDLHERLYSPSLSSGGGTERECLAFSQDIVNQQGNVSPLPHSNKPRSFPRTNPAYVGVPKRNGSTAYKRINIEQQSVNYDPAFSDPVTYNTTGMQVAPKDYVGGEYYYPHERSDSDTSHSSTRAIIHERTDSQASHSSRNRESDSQSSHGSFSKNIADVHSSHGSLQHQKQDSATSFHESISSRGSERNTSMNNEMRENIHSRSNSQLSQQSFNRVSDTSESEPDYANVPSSKDDEQTDVHIYREVLKDRKNIDFQDVHSYHGNITSSVGLQPPVDPSIMRGHRSLPVIQNYPPTEGKVYKHLKFC